MLTGFQAILFSHINLYFGIVLALNAYIFLEMIDSCWAQGKRAEAITIISYCFELWWTAINRNWRRSA